MNETPKKISHDCECCILCRGKFSAAKEKMRVFGKSNVDICSLVYRATNVDLSVYVDCEKLAICRTQCYNRIVRFNNALQKVDEISEEIRGYFGGSVSLRVKRMAKDNCKTLGMIDQVTCSLYQLFIVEFHYYMVHVQSALIVVSKS